MVMPRFIRQNLGILGLIGLVKFWKIPTKSTSPFRVFNNELIQCESKKLGHFYFYCNFVKCWPILIILSLSEPEIISAVI